MVMRRAGLKDANGVSAGPDGEPFVAYSEDQAREDYLDGNNY